MRWTNIVVETIPMQLNKYNVPMRHICHWCNADADYSVTRTSEIEGRSYTDSACQQHADEWTYASLYGSLYGKSVAKRSGKPFKSKMKVNTIKSVINHPIINEPACTFYEDDSFVSMVQCVLV